MTDQPEAPSQITKLGGMLTTKAMAYIFSIESENAKLRTENERLQEAKRMAGKIADERSRENVALRNEVAHLQFCLNSRDEYLGSIGKWEAYCATLPSGKAGVVDGWADSAHEQSAPTVTDTDTPHGT